MSFGRLSLTTLDCHRQVGATSNEAGGMLLGRFINQTQDIVVDEATAPTGEDSPGRFFFNRAKGAAQRYIDLAWGESSSTRVYLGEWHTHPEDVPIPSDHDLRNWRRITKRAQYHQDSLIFVIVGRQKIRAWICAKSTLAVSELEIVFQGRRDGAIYHFDIPDRQGEP